VVERPKAVVQEKHLERYDIPLEVYLFLKDYVGGVPEVVISSLSIKLETRCLVITSSIPGSRILSTP